VVLIVWNSKERINLNMTDAQAYKKLYGDIIMVVEFYRKKYNPLTWEVFDESHEESCN
jgi:hypothetical protein